MTLSVSKIRIQDLDHLGIVAGIIDSMNLVDQINQILGTHEQEIVVIPSRGDRAKMLNPSATI